MFQVIIPGQCCYLVMLIKEKLKCCNPSPRSPTSVATVLGASVLRSSFFIRHHHSRSCPLPIAATTAICFCHRRARPALVLFIFSLALRCRRLTCQTPMSKPTEHAGVNFFNFQVWGISQAWNLKSLRFHSRL